MQVGRARELGDDLAVNQEQQEIARSLLSLPFWEWREGMLHGEVDPRDKVFAYFVRCNSNTPPRSHHGYARLPVITDAPTGGAMLMVLAKHRSATPIMTLGLVLDRLTSRVINISDLTLGEACALAMLAERR